MRSDEALDIRHEARGVDRSMRKTLWDDRARDNLLHRIAALTPDAPAQWGRMCADEMLAHAIAGMRLAYGEIETVPRPGPFRYWPLKYLFVYWLPFPRHVRAPRELLTRGRITPEWDAHVTGLRALIADFPNRAQTAQWAVHPILGPLSGQAWGALGWKHIDHHLRQFGV